MEEGNEESIQTEETIIILPENIREDKIEEEDISEMADILEVDLEKHPELAVFVKEALVTKIPENWRLYKNRRGEIFYIDILTKEKREENPILISVREKIKNYLYYDKRNSYPEERASRLFEQKRKSDFKKNFELLEDKNKNEKEFFIDHRVSIQSLEKNFPEKNFEKKNFTFNNLNNDVVVLKKDALCDFNEQLNMLKYKIENLEKTIENKGNMTNPKKSSLFSNLDKIENRNSLNVDHEFFKNDKGKFQNSPTVLNLNKNDNYYKKENQHNLKITDEYAFEKDSQNRKNEEYYQKAESSKYSDPTFKSSYQMNNLRNSEFHTLKNEVSNLKTIIDKYMDKDKDQNQIVDYNPNYNHNISNLKSVYSPQKNFKRKIEHPNLTPFIQKSKESIIEKLDTFQKESEKKIFNLDFSNKRMQILFKEKKKLETEILKFNLAKQDLKKKSKYLKSLKLKIHTYIKENKKDSKIFLDLKETYSMFKRDLKQKEKTVIKKKSFLNLKKKMIEKFEEDLNTQNATYDFYNSKIKEFYSEIENLEKIHQVEKKDSLQVLDLHVNHKDYDISFSQNSEKSQKGLYSLNSHSNLKFANEKPNIPKEILKTKNLSKTQNFDLKNYGVKHLISDMQNKYKFQPKNEYITKNPENSKFNFSSNRSERKLNNSFTSKISNKTFLAPINKNNKCYSREMLHKKRNFSNSIYSRQTTFFKDLRNEVDGILKSFNVNKFS